MKRLSLLATLFFLSSAQIVFAGISSPYEVDEKPQVLFGDSVAVGEYEGLQNYSYDYVGGYIHISFTYTHHGCCFASYPPRLYITSANPVSTTTLTVKDQRSVFELQSQPVHLTDWYQYEIQFDSSGYTVHVTQATSTEIINEHRVIDGQTNTDWVALANQFPKQDPSSAFSMAFTPLPIIEEVAIIPVAATTTPIIVVPGITSTVLKKDGTEKWPNIPLMALSFDDSYLEDLSLNNVGEGSGSVVADSLLRNIGPTSFFSNLFSTLVYNGYVENESLYEFPYDWRLDLRNEVQKLKEIIDSIKNEKGVDKVDLVAHSMGGLLVKAYLKEYGGNSVDKFVDVATPHTGAPKAFKILNYGDNLDASFFFGFFSLNSLRVKSITQNMPAVYQLLPSENYFDESDPNYRYYVFNGINGNNRLTFNQTSDYMKSEGRNELLVDRAKEFHEEVDNLNPSDYGVETYNFVGCGTPTLGQFYILGEENGHTIYNVKMINGDGTVPLRSAEAIAANQTFYVRNAQHAVMPSTGGVKELIASILTATSTSDFDVSSYSNLSLTSSGCTVPNGKIVSFHSPIELHVYDSSGNHVGPDANGDIENNISGVSYEIIDGNKFAYLPDGLEYTIKGSATDAGKFDVRIQEVTDGEVVATTLYADIPLTLTTQTQFSLGTTMPEHILLDHDNDGTFESEERVSTTTIGLLETTGKIVFAPQSSESEPNMTSSHSQFSRPNETAVIREETISGIGILDPITSTGTPSESEKEVLNSAASDQVENEKVIDNESSSIQIVPEYENAAVVYKSFGYKVKSFFVSIWKWLRSKL